MHPAFVSTWRVSSSGLDGRVAHHEDGVHVRERAQIDEILHAPLADFRLRQLDHPDGLGETARAWGRRAARRNRAAHRPGAAAAGASTAPGLADVRDESAELTGREAGVEVVRTAGGMADQYGDGLAAVELLDRALRARRRGDRREHARRGDDMHQLHRGSIHRHRASPLSRPAAPSTARSRTRCAASARSARRRGTSG